MVGPTLCTKELLLDNLWKVIGFCLFRRLGTVVYKILMQWCVIEENSKYKNIFSWRDKPGMIIDFVKKKLGTGVSKTWRVIENMLNKISYVIKITISISWKFLSVCRGNIYF